MTICYDADSTECSASTGLFGLPCLIIQNKSEWFASMAFLLMQGVDKPFA